MYLAIGDGKTIAIEDIRTNKQIILISILLKTPIIRLKIYSIRLLFSVDLRISLVASQRLIIC